MRGRYPCGPEYVQRLDASPQAKQRLEVLLELLTGACRVKEACARLGLSEQRLRQLRERALQAAAASLEPRSAGRPAQAPVSAEVMALEKQLTDLHLELRAAQTREEIAVVLPKLQQQPAAPAQKKTRRSRT